MLLGWLNARRAVEVGTALADQYAPPPVAAASASLRSPGARRDQASALQELLRRAERDTQSLQLNVYQKAKFAHSFKWRLLENGVEEPIADELTSRLLLHLSVKAPPDPAPAPAGQQDPAGTGTVRSLMGRGDQYMARGAYAEALLCYESMVELDPRNSKALNGLGAALCRLGRYREAEQFFRRALRLKPNAADVLANLGALLRWRGQGAASEYLLRRSLKLQPGDAETRSSLGLTLLRLGRTGEAKSQLQKALKVAPRHPNALFGMAQIARTEGQFDEASALLQRLLEQDPKTPSALAELANLRKMTVADAAWLKRAEELAASGLMPLEEADLRFALGKYYDDVQDYARAFQNYRRANALQKAVAEEYDRTAQTRSVDDLIRTYTREVLAAPAPGASASDRPIFVVGMMRSGTSLAEQIIASHPSVHGAGELPFWSDAVRRHEAAVREGALDAALRTQLATEYLRVLEGVAGGARRVVDKAPVNSEYLGIIHSVFPQARIIYMRRDPIDTCLSCYFQQFSAALNFTMDLEDLAHYYREHQRLMAHWRSALPQNAMLEVPYSQLVSDQERWTRRMLEFLGLEWEPRCLDFHRTQRTVPTASAWQVRQKIYTDSVERWRHYSKYLGPLKDLRDPDSSS
jgi:tetratricopeptide (TPR) repeat protein